MNIKNTNKGTGAGGSQTNINGLAFEDKTSNENELIKMGYKKIQILGTKNKYDYYLINDTNSIIFTKKRGLNTYLKMKYNIFTLREPDEAYIINNINSKPILIILEKKNQNCQGSVELKLWASIGLKLEYEKITENIFDIYYCFCLNDFLKQKINSNDKKYVILMELFKEYNIKVFYGDDNNYFNDINEHLKSFL